MKKILKLSAILIIVILQLIILPTRVKANDIFYEADNFLYQGRSEARTEINNEDIQQTNAMIYNTLLALGVALAVIIGGILGIKFMLSSAEGKAEIKQLLVPYIIGCVVIFGAFGIWKIAVQIGQNIGEDTTKEYTIKTYNKGDYGGDSTVHESESGEIHGGSEGRGF